MIQPLEFNLEVRYSPDDLLWAMGQAKGRTIRDIGTFADEEIIIPRGPFADQKYSQDRKPASRLWFDEITSKRWQVHNYVAPTQSGKSLDGFVIPILWCLFEKIEDVIVGVPDLDKMANAKWKKDILPVIEKSRYAHLVPTKGQGSRGGKPNEIQFLNGATLTFMGFGGGDKARAGDTAPNLIITEVDGANEVSTTSEEGTKIQQLMGRTLAFDDKAFIVKECTVTTDQGIIYSSYFQGSRGVVMRPCCKCKEWVSPERLNFKGWEVANSDIEAGELAKFHCPACGKSWTDKERFEMNRKVKLVHRGQRIEKGEVVGEFPKTTELGFRYSAIDNMFRSAKKLGERMWKESRSENKEAADKTIFQQEFAEPWVLSDDEIVKIDPYVAMRRIGSSRQGIIPNGFDLVTVGTDLRMREMHSVVGSWLDDATVHLPDYGKLKVHSQRLGVEMGLLTALRYYRDEVLAKGFLGEDGEIHHVDQWWIDANWQSPTVYRFVSESWEQERWDNVIFPYLGRGRNHKFGRFSLPSKTTNLIHHLGDEFYFKYDHDHHVHKIFVNADYYKSFVHNRVRIPLFDKDGEMMPGALSLFVPSAEDHLEYMRHLAAEEEIKEFIQDKGEVTTWRTKSRVNHFFDASYAMCAAAVYMGVRTTPEVEIAEMESEFEQGEEFDEGLVMPDGRQFTM